MGMVQIMEQAMELAMEREWHLELEHTQPKEASTLVAMDTQDVPHTRLAAG